MNTARSILRWVPLGLLLAACAGGAEGPGDRPPATAAAAQPPASTGSPSEGAAPTWRLGAVMPSTRSEMPAVALNGLIYVPGGFGGTRLLEAYDPATDTWKTLADMPSGRHHLMAAAYDGQLYVFGGSPPLSFGATKTAWRYSPETDSWAELADMPELVTAGAAVTLGETIFLVGGGGSAGEGEMLAFSPEQGSWRVLPGPEVPREHLAAVAFEGKLWALGGRWRGIGEHASVEIYDPESETWSRGPSLQVPRAGFAAGVVGGTLVAAGGEVIFTGNETLGSVEVLDSAQNVWVFATELPFPVHGLGAAALGEALYLPGGSDRAGSIDNQGRLQIYGP